MFEGSHNRGAAGGDGRLARPGLANLPRQRNRDSLAMLMPYGRRWRQLRQAAIGQGAAQTLQCFSVLPVETMQSKRPLVAHKAPTPSHQACKPRAAVHEGNRRVGQMPAADRRVRGGWRNASADACYACVPRIGPGKFQFALPRTRNHHEHGQAHLLNLWPKRAPGTVHGWGETGKGMLGVPSLSNFMPFPYHDSRRSFQGSSRCNGRWVIAPRTAQAQANWGAGRSGFVARLGGPGESQSRGTRLAPTPPLEHA